MENILNSGSKNSNEVPLRNYNFNFPISENDSSESHLSRRRRPLPGRKTSLPRKSIKSISVPTLPQARLPFENRVSEHETLLLQKRINAHMKGSLELKVTDNRSSIISVKRVGGVHKVRLHHMFLSADHRVLKALGRYIEKADSYSSNILENFIENNAGLIRELPIKRKKEKLYHTGKYFDLKEIFDSLNDKYFDGKIKAKISWGVGLRGQPRHHKSAKMGTYSIEEKIIRIHNALDREFIPRFFIESIIHHEMVHQLVGIDVVNGRNQYHSEKFQKLEQKFEHYFLAKQWEKENITRLLYF